MKQFDDAMMRVYKGQRSFNKSLPIPMLQQSKTQLLGIVEGLRGLAKDGEALLGIQRSNNGWHQ